MSNGSVNLGSGADTLTLANTANSGTISNVKTIMGGSGSDTITLGAAASNASIDLGSGTDTPDPRQLQQHRHGRQRRRP